MRLRGLTPPCRPLRSARRMPWGRRGRSRRPTRARAPRRGRLTLARPRRWPPRSTGRPRWLRRGRPSPRPGCCRPWALSDASKRASTSASPRGDPSKLLTIRRARSTSSTCTTGPSLGSGFLVAIVGPYRSGASTGCRSPVAIVDSTGNVSPTGEHRHPGGARCQPHANFSTTPSRTSARSSPQTSLIRSARRRSST